MSRLISSAALAAAALSLAACGSDGGASTELVSSGAILAGVSVDQVTVASYATAQRQPNGVLIGTLQVSPYGGGAPTVLDAQVTAPSFARGTALHYLQGATQVTEGTPPVTRAFGVPKVWLPSQAAPVTLGGIATQVVLSQDGSTAIFVDRASASIDATGTVKAWNTSLCAATCAAPIVLGQGVASANPQISDDGSHAIVAIPAVGDGSPQIVLVTFPGGTVTTLSAAVNARSPMMSSDGATVAWVEGTSIVVAQAANPTIKATITITAPDGSAPTVQSAIMVNAGEFVARLKIGTDQPELYLVTAASSTALGVTSPVRFSVVQATPSGDVASARWLFFATDQDPTTGAEDLWALDLTDASAQPVQIASQTSGNPAFSDDGLIVRYFDSQDQTTGFGDLFVGGLPPATTTMVAPGIRTAVFEPGSQKLLYIAAPDPVTFAGALTVYSPAATVVVPDEVSIPGVVNVGVSRTTPTMYYTQDQGMASDGVYQAAPL